MYGYAYAYAYGKRGFGRKERKDVMRFSLEPLNIRSANKVRRRRARLVGGYEGEEEEG